jgi:hypothetical protein
VSLFTAAATAVDWQVHTVLLSRFWRQYQQQLHLHVDSIQWPTAIDGQKKDFKKKWKGAETDCNESLGAVQSTTTSRNSTVSNSTLPLASITETIPGPATSAVAAVCYELQRLSSSFSSFVGQPIVIPLVVIVVARFFFFCLAPAQLVQMLQHVAQLENEVEQNCHQHQLQQQD